MLIRYGLKCVIVYILLTNCCTCRHRWHYSLQTWVTLLCARKWIHIEIDKKFDLIHEKEWTGESVSNICKRYGISRKSYYKWKNRYKQNGMEGLADLSRRPHNINYKKITLEVDETILDLRVSKRFGCRRIKFRLKRTVGLSLSTRTIYKMLKRHGLNILKCQSKINKIYKRFTMEHPNDMVQMDILGPFYLSNSNAKNYFITAAWMIVPER